MAKRRGLRYVLWLAGGVVALLLAGWLVLSVVSNTTLSADLENQEVASETTLGNLKCRKELEVSFPFFKLECQNTAARP